MRAIVVGVLMLVAGPAFGGAIVSDEPRPPSGVEERAAVVAPPSTVELERYEVHRTPPMGHIVVEDHASAGTDFGLALAATGMSLVYTPFRMAVGLVGAGLGGFSGWATGGDLRTARSIWRPTVDGHYYVRRDHMDDREPFLFNGVVGEKRVTEVRTAPVVVTMEDEDDEAEVDESLVEPEDAPEGTTY